MGVLFQGVCHPSTASAKREACSSVSKVWGDGASLMTANCTTTDFTLPDMSVCVRIDGGACSTQVLPYPNFPACDHDAVVSDMSDLFGLALVAIVAVVCARWAYSIFNPSRRGDDPL